MTINSPLKTPTSQPIRIALCQVNTTVGDVSGNADSLLAHAQALYGEQAQDLLVFPELALTGYPPEDLLLRPQFLQQVAAALDGLAERLPCAALLGAPAQADGALYNAAYLISNGRAELVYRKQCLPNYGVFDEKRYFAPGAAPALIELGGYRLGICICEDLWSPAPAAAVRAAGAQGIISLNASPYHQGKQQERIATAQQRVAETGLPVAYVNLYGGQDELVFDGGSFAVNADSLLAAPRFAAANLCLNFAGQAFSAVAGQGAEPLESLESLEPLAELYAALVLATRDYVNKNGFNGVLIGLSGGIDSALTLAIAVDALGAERVEAIMLPSRYTSEMSLHDAAQIADNFKVSYHIASIESSYQAVLAELNPLFGGAAVDTTEENIQARVRGLMVMALSNKKGLMVLTTGNKSEYAVGYSTLYGDMVGGYAPLKDVSKTLVFALSRWRNQSDEGEMIPERIITRPPSAELAPDQKDEDSLPPYAILDQILQRYVEQCQSAEEIIAAGFAAEQVRDTVQRVNRNEYKRRQSAPGVKVTRYAFGRERRYPITSGFA
ncbi:MAG: NAD+ synthase [Gammaproteobacteria bacterium]|nr:MAG: NAD+ synthase [Gammaproteobacteria bacterium]